MSVSDASLLNKERLRSSKIKSTPAPCELFQSFQIFMVESYKQNDLKNLLIPRKYIICLSYSVEKGGLQLLVLIRFRKMKKNNNRKYPC